MNNDNVNKAVNDLKALAQELIELNDKFVEHKGLLKWAIDGVKAHPYITAGVVFTGIAVIATFAPVTITGLLATASGGAVHLAKDSGSTIFNAIYHASNNHQVTNVAFKITGISVDYLKTIAIAGFVGDVVVGALAAKDYFYSAEKSDANIDHSAYPNSSYHMDAAGDINHQTAE